MPVDISESVWRGPSAPFGVDGTGDLGQTAALDAVRQRIATVLGTKAASDVVPGGECPWRPEFGSHIYLLRHRPIDEGFRQLGMLYISEAIQRWVPEALLTGVDFRVGRSGDGDPVAIFDARFRLRSVRAPEASYAVVTPGGG